MTRVAQGLVVFGVSFWVTVAWGQPDPFPGLNLPKPAFGKGAVVGLGEHLPQVAAWYKMQADTLRDRLLADSALGVDKQGRLFYADRHAPVAGQESSQPISAEFPLSETFRLHSRPNAKKVIYLDFDGELVSGTAWNTNFNDGMDIVAAPFDQDGNPGSFSDAERRRIQEIFVRVAEDYAPFDVDVTTEEPSPDQLLRTSSGDDRFGTRVVITPTSAWFGNAGGVAYLRVFNRVGETYKPAWVFANRLAPTSSSHAKYVAEACSHEAGHNLGLDHDGTTDGAAYYSGHGSGATGWAPIMGNSYSKAVTQWSKGEYAKANNTQDDLAIIQQYGEFGYRVDDHGNGFSNATVLTANDGTIAALGTIERSSDVDVFSFVSGSGTLSLSVAGDVGTNVDLRLRVYSQAGQLLATASPTSGLTVSLSLTVNSGVYFATLDGVGHGDPATTGYSDYASLGLYSLSGTVSGSVDPLPPTARITATPTTGKAPLPVAFKGDASSDPDGTIVSYAWSFGDGNVSTAVNPSHTYATEGTYTARLTVTDTSGLSHTASVAIAVLPPNQPPVAAISANPTSGVAPLVVAFDASGSQDPDGEIAAYRWEFGDGAIGMGSTVSHTFAAGSYVVRLTVVDEDGASATQTVGIEVAPGAMTLKVESITLSQIRRGGRTRFVARVRVASSPFVEGVRVSGTWSGLVSGTATGLTTSDGTVEFTSAETNAKGQVTFTVTSVSQANYTFDATGPSSASATTKGGGKKK